MYPLECINYRVVALSSCHPERFLRVRRGKRRDPQALVHRAVGANHPAQKSLCVLVDDEHWSRPLWESFHRSVYLTDFPVDLSFLQVIFRS